jgi:hypothetical protein
VLVAQPVPIVFDWLSGIIVWAAMLALRRL